LLYWFEKEALLHLGTDEEDGKVAEVQVQKLLNLLRREHGSEVAETCRKRKEYKIDSVFVVKRKVN